MNTIFDELACAATGTDCPATAAWLQQTLRQLHPLEAARAEAFWNAADENLQSALFGKLGINEPHRADPKIHDAIVRDFDRLLLAANAQLDFAA